MISYADVVSISVAMPSLLADFHAESEPPAAREVRSLGDSTIHLSGLSADVYAKGTSAETHRWCPHARDRAGSHEKNKWTVPYNGWRCLSLILDL